MKIRLAKSAGFCYGVKRAVELAESAAQSGEPCVMLGYIIHNSDVVDRLARQGVTVVERPEDVPEGCGVIIRSHGESRETYECLEKRGARILDATCPNVKRIHQIVSQAEEQGRQPVIIGTPHHPEVTAIAGWCRHPVVLSGAQELEEWLQEDENRKNLPLTFVSQTTSTRKIWDGCVKKAKKECTNAEFLIQYAERHRNARRKPISSPRSATKWWSSATVKAPTPNAWRRFAGNPVRTCSLLSAQRTWI